jgi:hypothetical protein
MIIQMIRRDATGADQIDEASNLSRPDQSGADQIDVEHQATDMVLVTNVTPDRCSPTTAPGQIA